MLKCRIKSHISITNIGQLTYIVIGSVANNEHESMFIESVGHIPKLDRILL